jgi:hypothetical protein
MINSGLESVIREFMVLDTLNLKANKEYGVFFHTPTLYYGLPYLVTSKLMKGCERETEI